MFLLAEVTSEVAIGGGLQKNLFLKIFAMFTGKRLCWSLFLIKLKKRLQHRLFALNIAKCLRFPLLKKHLRMAASSMPRSSKPSFQLGPSHGGRCARVADKMMQKQK